MSEHTPGEWFVASPEGTLVYSRSDEGSICQLKFLKGRHGLGGRRDPDEVEANARLIAAAPKLLAALKQAKHGAEYPDELGDIIDAAIAEAEGNTEQAKNGDGTIPIGRQL